MTHRTPAVVGHRDGLWLSFHGIPSHILALGEDTLNAYTATRGLASPGTPTPPHSHSFEEGFYVISGNLVVQAGNETVTLGAGGFVNVGAGTVHCPSVEDGETADVLVICAPAGFDRFQRAIGVVAPPDGPFPPGNAAILDIATDLAREHGIELAPDLDDLHHSGRITVRQAGDGCHIAVAGDVYTYLASAEDTNGQYALLKAVVHPGGGPPPHLHRKEEEAFFILKGELSIFAGGDWLTATAGDWVLAPRDAEHAFTNNTNEPVEMLILLAPAGLEEMFLLTGTPWADPQEAPGRPKATEVKRMMDMAPKYGIEFMSGD